MEQNAESTNVPPPLPFQDRILFKSNNGGKLHGVGYSSCQSILHSDHRCVCTHTVQRSF